MIDEMLCPDCGGVVGATETTDAGAPCRCFAHLSASHNSTLMGDTVDGESTTDSPASAVAKICIVCGKDVAGHRRVKDSRGYTCYDCAKEEIKKERGDRVRCRSCGHLVKESTLENYEGTKICMNCMAERKKLQKEQVKRIGVMAARSSVESYRTLIIAGVAGLLLLLIILHSLHVLK